VEPPISVGLRVPAPVFPRGAKAVADFVAAAEEAGLDRLCIGDHVTFQGGQGFDALINATALAALSQRVQIETAVYLLPLRHPVPVARQVVSIAELAPGRFRFGVGIGGEDPREVLACGVDPATRGRRMDEALPLVRGLLQGNEVTGAGPHFPVEQVCFRSTAAADVPILVGGRSAAALRRAGRYGDGWLGLWVTPDRFRESCTAIEASAVLAGRDDVQWQHAMHVWCGFDDDTDVARSRLAAAMESLYRTSYEKFARYSPAGRPADVAAFLRGYVNAGCRSFNLLAVAASDKAAIDGAQTVRALLEDNV
jgi:alkanesulfonate monooxygenase SsuD/methylene tetrahydromethanopterin reductase-like flavin-dependent oxidoreductase (luciferase family)